ncbi:class I adenylate-forming enzyme family protein [Nocardiopsis tropica]|uniref:Class I adenylate-forming enzyme family protein n=1 Tax=Nocardiopsis tropica TaxID=109330 RepID=A0ABU7KU72_9ACTN|nr:class I adenylate-forming enzyme family protein [Nocardiopsis umidischolae]MEE2052819.1 class I adenylate-forming enzyme family protein [Nocardiopsis umidischolae]
MAVDELSPGELIAKLSSAPELSERPWTVRWDALDEPVEEVLTRLLPPETEFSTSGSTGRPRLWLRTREQLMDEGRLLAGLLRGARPEALVSFAPPRHVYGMLASVLVPAHLGVPAWYVPQFAPLPPRDHRRWAVMAIPWTFRVLRQRTAWLDTAERLAFVHSTAVLPQSAGDLLSLLGERASLTEVFGSTETGGVAHREWSPGDPPWRLFPDVGFGHGPDLPGREAPLVVRSPRIARPRTGAAVTECRMDDHVVRLDDRSFAFAGRRTRLVNVNGRRLDLDLMEERLAGVLECDDLACVPVRDPLTGEHFDLLIVPAAAGPPGAEELRNALDRIEYRPRSVRAVERIDRSETGKLRRVQPARARPEGVDR